MRVAFRYLLAGAGHVLRGSIGIIPDAVFLILIDSRPTGASRHQHQSQDQAGQGRVAGCRGA